MQIDVKKVDASKRQITIKLTPEELREVEKDVIRNLQKKVTLPGFRKGHIPPAMFRRNFGEAIKAEIPELAIAKYYSEMLAETDLKPVGVGEITRIDFKEIEEGMEFDIELEEEPEIELRKYKNLKVEKEIAVVTDEMVDQTLLNIRKRFATSKAVEMAAKGHFITFTAQLLGEGDTPVIGKKYDQITLEIGSGEFDPGFEEQLIGMEVGGERIIRRMVPPRPGEKSREPLLESYKVTAEAIEERELPPLDDDLAKNLDDEKIETLEQLKDALRKDLQYRLERRSNSQFYSRLADEALKENPFEVPDSMLNRQLDSIVERIQERYPDEEIDEATVREKNRADAIYALRWHLLKKQIARAESISVSDEETLKFIDSLNITVKEKHQRKKNKDYLYDLKQDLLEEKILHFLSQNADIVEVFVQPQAEEGAITRV